MEKRLRALEEEKANLKKAMGIFAKDSLGFFFDKQGRNPYRLSDLPTISVICYAIQLAKNGKYSSLLFTKIPGFLFADYKS